MTFLGCAPLHHKKWFCAAYGTEKLFSLVLVHTISKAKMHFMTPYALCLARLGGCMELRRQNDLKLGNPFGNCMDYFTG